MTYNIITNHGTVDFAPDIETANRKFEQYKRYMFEGYNKYVLLIERETNKTIKRVNRYE